MTFDPHHDIPTLEILSSRLPTARRWAAPRLGRTEAWLHKSWHRYLEFGAEGLYDLTRARHVVQRIPPELERTSLTIRRRLQAHATPATRYRLIGAPGG
jgi:hypothetical protein